MTVPCLPGRATQTWELETTRTRPPQREGTEGARQLRPGDACGGERIRKATRQGTATAARLAVAGRPSARLSLAAATESRLLRCASALGRSHSPSTWCKSTLERRSPSTLPGSTSTPSGSLAPPSSAPDFSFTRCLPGRSTSRSSPFTRSSCRFGQRCSLSFGDAARASSHTGGARAPPGRTNRDPHLGRQTGPARAWPLRLILLLLRRPRLRLLQAPRRRMRRSHPQTRAVPLLVER